MTALTWIIVMSLAGGLISVLVAAGFSYAARPNWVPVLISYAIGALLGAAFLEVLPHAIEAAESPEHATITILAGILLFFILEKLVLWRHCHDEGCHGHGQDHAGHGHGHSHAGHDHGRSGLMILVGDTFHNFVDGVLIAAAFVESTPLGIVTAMAIIAHEIPQEVGDFLILLHSGYSRAKALAFNLLSSLATLLGGILAYFALSHVQALVPVFLGLAAASMIYVAVADLIPGLHKRTELRATMQQVLLIAAGIASVVLAHPLAEGALG
ncbi:ZIP family metal transporter [Zoogloea sp.]|uniref:ZIP family metal transporter n=1 Tax=Zoogloea sp. TaxID=49181 RepID=UPI002607EC20|nr:ZIP family metal transporter [Zoogloea sp.]MDD3352737.1 ZIP family metal transporter [Zoogloea sp.]